MSKRTIKTLIACFALLLCAAAPLKAHAQEQATAPASPLAEEASPGVATSERCSKYSDPEIFLNRIKGGLFISPALTEEALASQKSRLFGRKMPDRQGNVGHPEIHHKTNMKIAKFPTTGCVYLERLQIDVRIDQRMYIAGEYPEGSCLYNGFYELEAELMQLDEDIIDASFKKMNAYLHSLPEAIRAAGPTTRGSIHDLEKSHQENIQRIVDSFVMQLEKDLMTQRRDADDPSFYYDIQSECEGMP